MRQTKRQKYSKGYYELLRIENKIADFKLRYVMKYLFLKDY